MVTALTEANYEPPRAKRLLARMYAVMRVHAFDELRRRVMGPVLMAINYHSTPSAFAQSFERQLAWYSATFASMKPEDLGSFLGGRWQGAAPALMLHFDDGFLEHATVAAPLLEKHGMRGWFHLVTDAVDRASAGVLTPERSMTWDHARALARRGHAICSHTRSHRRLKAGLSDAELEYEILGSFDRLAAELSEEPLGFCWPGGEDDAYGERALRLIASRYRYAFPSFTKPIKCGDSPYCLPRSNVEAQWSIDAVRLSLGGLWEWKHRRRAAGYARTVAVALDA